MTPLLLLAIAASTTSGTIHHTTGSPNPITERSTPTMAIQFPIRHPSKQPDQGKYAAPGPAHRGAATGYPNTGTNKLAQAARGVTPIEHTNRPR